jgi:hypothetical protein
VELALYLQNADTVVLKEQALLHFLLQKALEGKRKHEIEAAKFSWSLSILIERERKIG